MSKKNLTLYDVCNDYSLCADVSEQSRAAAESGAYSWWRGKIKGTPALFGYEKATDELHFVKIARDDLQDYLLDYF